MLADPEKYFPEKRFKDTNDMFKLSFMLCRKAQERAAERAGISMDYLVKEPPGPRKREIVDDITVIVADLSQHVKSL